MTNELHDFDVSVLEALKAIDDRTGKATLGDIIDHFNATGEERAAAYYRSVRRLGECALVSWNPPAPPPHDLKRETQVSITGDGKFELESRGLTERAGGSDVVGNGG